MPCRGCWCAHASSALTAGLQTQTAAPAAAAACVLVSGISAPACKQACSGAGPHTCTRVQAAPPPATGNRKICQAHAAVYLPRELAGCEASELLDLRRLPQLRPGFGLSPVILLRLKLVGAGVVAGACVALGAAGVTGGICRKLPCAAVSCWVSSCCTRFGCGQARVLTPPAHAAAGVAGAAVHIWLLAAPLEILTGAGTFRPLPAVCARPDDAATAWSRAASFTNSGFVGVMSSAGTCCCVEPAAKGAAACHARLAGVKLGLGPELLCSDEASATGVCCSKLVGVLGSAAKSAPAGSTPRGAAVLASESRSCSRGCCARTGASMLPGLGQLLEEEKGAKLLWPLFCCAGDSELISCANSSSTSACVMLSSPSSTLNCTHSRRRSSNTGRVGRC